MDIDIIKSLTQTGGITGVMGIGLYMMYKYILTKDDVIQGLNREFKETLLLVVDANEKQNKAMGEMSTELKLLQSDISAIKSCVDKKSS